MGQSHRPEKTIPDSYDKCEPGFRGLFKFQHVCLRTYSFSCIPRLIKILILNTELYTLKWQYHGKIVKYYGNDNRILAD